MHNDKPIVRINLQEIWYGDLCFPIRIVKKYIVYLFEENLKPYTIYKTFNPSTGLIDRKYAWDTILFDFNKGDRLANILDKILEDESEGAFLEDLEE